MRKLLFMKSVRAKLLAMVLASMLSLPILIAMAFTDYQIQAVPGSSNIPNAARNLAFYYATMTASSTLNPVNTPASHTNDNNSIHGLWRPNTAGYEWLTARFNEPKNFNQIRIYQHGNRIRNYRIEYSHNGANWNLLHSRASTPEPLSTYFFSTSITAQYVRLSIGYSFVNNQVAILQFDIRYMPAPTLSAILPVAHHTTPSALALPLYEIPPGGGTQQNPWRIYNRYHLKWINETPTWQRHFLLMNDITAADNFRIGFGGGSLDLFTGHFDGNGHTINVNINELFSPLQFDTGLFAYIGAGGIIENLSVNGSVSGSQAVGGIAGINNGIIRNSSFEGSVNGSLNMVGGLAGLNFNIIENSHAIANVNGNNNVGGLVGANISTMGRIRNSYTIANVSGADNVGGLIGGQGTTSSVEGSRASGTVSGNNNYGYAIGFFGATTTAVWPVIFNLNGGIYQGSTNDVERVLAHNEIATYLTLEVSRQSYIFTGWYPEEAVVNGGITRTAMWYNPNPPDPDPDPDPAPYPPQIPSPEPNPVPDPAPTPSPSPTPPTPAPPGAGIPTPDSPEFTETPTPRTTPANNNAPRVPRTNNRITLITRNITIISNAVSNIYRSEAPQHILRFVINQYQFTHNEQIFTSEAAPFIYHNRTMVPLRIIAEALGADVGWDGDTRIVSISLDGMTLHLAVDETLPDGMGVPIIRQGRTLVPVRFVSETLGAYVRWDRDNLAVYVYDMYRNFTQDILACIPQCNHL